jgi:hypothetical protein
LHALVHREEAHRDLLAGYLYDLTAF